MTLEGSSPKAQARSQKEALEFCRWAGWTPSRGLFVRRDPPLHHQQYGRRPSTRRDENLHDVERRFPKIRRSRLTKGLRDLDKRRGWRMDKINLSGQGLPQAAARSRRLLRTWTNQKLEPGDYEDAVVLEAAKTRPGEGQRPDRREKRRHRSWIRTRARTS